MIFGNPNFGEDTFATPLVVESPVFYLWLCLCDNPDVWVCEPENSDSYTCESDTDSEWTKIPAGPTNIQECQ